MAFSPDELLAALPRLRRYARFLVEDAVRADRMVEETVSRARHLEGESLRTSPALRLLALLRSVYTEAFAQPQLIAASPRVNAREPNAPGTSDVTAREPVSKPRHSNDVVGQLFRLPLEQREVLALVAVERMSYEETAVLLAIPVATVFARLVAARQALHSMAALPTAEPKSAT
jgi:DNA-directed RNA polymerase specialized sigma24 family protein